MSLIPNIFGENDRYIVILPLSFWVYYSFISNYSFFSILQIIIGIFLLISQIYRDKFDQYIEESKTKNTRDFSNFIKQNPLLIIVGILIYPYYLSVLILGFIIKKDWILYFLLIANLIGIVYVIMVFTLRPESRQKIIEIKDFLLNKDKK